MASLPSLNRGRTAIGVKSDTSVLQSSLVPGRGDLRKQHSVKFLQQPGGCTSPIRTSAPNSPGSSSSAAGMQVSASLSGIGNLFEKLVGGIFPPQSSKASAAVATSSGPQSGTVLWKGSLVLRKRLLALDLTDLAADKLDDVEDFLGSKVSVQLVSNTSLDPKTGEGLRSPEVKILNWAGARDLPVATNFTFKLEFQVPKDFGSVGAIIVKNGHTFEFLLVSFELALPDNSKVVNFTCNSWVYNTTLREGRIFFSNQVYVPGQTPPGLVALRAKELTNLRGDGTGERAAKDRIYDYAIYNDLGNPDANPKQKRTPLGGSKDFPYPRRCRTGRPPTKTDPASESKPSNLLSPFYVPRDEQFGQIKEDDFLASGARSVTHSAGPTLRTAETHDPNFSSLDQIFQLYTSKGTDKGVMKNLQPVTTRTVGDPLEFFHEFILPQGEDTNLLKYPLPNILAVNKDAWSLDQEFAREFVAGLNPLAITRLTEFPIKSKLDPSTYGDPVSAITAKIVNSQLPDGWDVEKALKENKLFVVDYHDGFLPYTKKINDLETSSIYATRTLMFLTSDGTLQVIAIELVLPPQTQGAAKNSRVFTPPPKDSTKNWVWELAKAHVLSNDSSYHQIFSHFTRTHGAVEPIIIATNRQLSALHPINLAIVPHFKNTMDINAAARKALINSGGIVETSFTPQQYSMELGSVLYKLDWRFDEQGLPTDLVKRGIAVPDSNAKHGLKLFIEDYPYAVDGLELWAAIKSWFSDFVDIVYPDDSGVVGDVELQSWWNEIRTVGHGDKKDEPGWPELNSKQNLIQILTTIAWVASCHHAAVNFGQYEYAGFMPNHPTTTRKLIPEEGTPDWQSLQDDPVKFYLSSVSNQTQATVVMATIEILSTHSADEEYLGQRLLPNWTNDPKILAAFDKYSKKIAEIDTLIKARNADPSLKNRLGPVHIPYELLRPISGQGITGKGVPNSVSI